MLRWVRNELEVRGYQVTDALSGEHGLHLYQTEGPFNFVLSDYLFLPSRRIKNGLELVHAIVSLHPDQRIAIHTSEENLKASGNPLAT